MKRLFVMMIIMFVASIGWAGLNEDLFEAVRKGDKKRVVTLIKKGADINAKDSGSWTPLHVAADRGRIEIAKLLLKKGADVKAKTKDGRTPLHGAASYGNREIAKLLIAKEADVNARTKAGKTPLDFAESEEMKKLLIKADGKRGKE